MRKNKLFSILAVFACVCAFGLLGTACDGDGAQGGGKDEYRIELRRETLDLVEYDTYELQAELFKNDETVTGTIAWESSNEKVASVDADGKVTAVAEGKATVTALWNGQVAKCEIVVSKYYDPEWAVSLSDNVLSLYKTQSGEESVTLTVTARFGGETIDDGYVLTWSSDDENIASVDESGSVTAVAEGKTTVTVKAEYETFTAYATCEVTVSEPKINVFDGVEYDYETGASTNVAKIPVKAEYGAVVSVTDEKGDAVKFSVENGCVLPDFSESDRRGNVELLIETATHAVFANVCVADGFIYTKDDLYAATQKMSEGKLFVLKADIDMSDYVWTTTETEVRVNYVAQRLKTRKLFTFKGDFDGNGHKLYNISETDQTKYLEIFSFAPNSHVFDLDIVTSDVKMFNKEAVNYVFGEIGTGATVENCRFDLNISSRVSWQDELFSTINGSLKDCVIRFRDKSPFCLLSSLLKGEADNITFIGVETELAKIRLGGTNGTNYSQMAGIMSDLRFFATEENYQNGVGTRFIGNGAVRYNGQEYSFADWWGNKIDLNGDGTVDATDKTWSIVVTEPMENVSNGNA